MRLAVGAELAGVARHPLQRGIALLELRRKLRRRQRRILDEHADLPRADDEVAQQPLVVLEIADDPHAAMQEEEHARLCRSPSPAS